MPQCGTKKIKDNPWPEPILDCSINSFETRQKDLQNNCHPMLSLYWLIHSARCLRSCRFITIVRAHLKVPTKNPLL